MAATAEDASGATGAAGAAAREAAAAALAVPVQPTSTKGAWPLMVATMRNYPSRTCATASLGNNDAATWRGEVTMHRLREGSHGSGPQCVELRSGIAVNGTATARRATPATATATPATVDVAVKLDIQGFDVAVLKCCLVAA